MHSQQNIKKLKAVVVVTILLRLLPHLYVRYLVLDHWSCWNAA